MIAVNSSVIYLLDLYSQTYIKQPLKTTGRLIAKGTWLFNRSGLPENVGHGPVFSLSNASTNKCKWRKRKPIIMMVFMRPVNVNKSR